MTTPAPPPSETPKTTLPTTMHAIHHTAFGPPQTSLSLTTTHPTPKLSTPTTLLLHVTAASTHAGDWHLIRGTPFFIRLLFGGNPLRPTIPIPGCEVSGTVVSKGMQVSDDFKVGDVVFADVSECGFGAFAQFVAVEERFVARVPEGVDGGVMASCCTSALAALQALRDCGGISGGERVLVNGATGGVGSFAVQMAKVLGAGYVCAVGNGNKLDKVCDVVKHVPDCRIDHTKGDVVEQLLAKWRDESNGDEEQLFDVVIDTACFQSVRYFRRVLKRGARFVIVGGDTGRFMRGMVFGAGLLKLTMGVVVSVLESKPTGEDLKVVGEMVAKGEVVPVVDRTVSLAEVPQAVAAVEAREVTGKIVIDVAASTPQH